MPTVLFLNGWRLFFYANEGDEPIHIHAKKAEMECKYWIDVEGYDIREAFHFEMSPRDIREVREIIFGHFEYIVAKWNEIHGDLK